MVFESKVSVTLCNLTLENILTQVNKLSIFIGILLTMKVIYYLLSNYKCLNRSFDI